jgi:hypothetical protein
MCDDGALVAAGVPLLDGECSTLFIEHGSSDLGLVEKSKANDEAESQQGILLQDLVLLEFEQVLVKSIDAPEGTQDPKAADDPGRPRKLPEAELCLVVFPNIFVLDVLLRTQFQ